jgi:hypothetical protein
LKTYKGWFPRLKCSSLYCFWYAEKKEKSVRHHMWQTFVQSVFFSSLLTMDKQRLVNAQISVVVLLFYILNRFWTNFPFKVSNLLYTHFFLLLFHKVIRVNPLYIIYFLSSQCYYLSSNQTVAFNQSEQSCCHSFLHTFLLRLNISQLL